MVQNEMGLLVLKHSSLVCCSDRLLCRFPSYPLVLHPWAVCTSRQLKNNALRLCTKHSN